MSLINPGILSDRMPGDFSGDPATDANAMNTTIEGSVLLGFSGVFIPCQPKNVCSEFELKLNLCLGSLHESH